MPNNPLTNPLLLTLGRGFVLLLGVISLSVLSAQLVRDTELFTNPKFEHFWTDVQNHHLKTEGWKTDTELARQYGPIRITGWVINPGWGGVTLPSDDAVTTAIIGAVINDNRKAGQRGTGAPLEWELLAGFVFAFLVLVAPIVYTARQLQRAMTWGLCRSRAAQEARGAYFAPSEWRVVVWSIPVSLAAASGLAFLNAHQQITPEMESQSVTLPKLAVGLLWAGYAGGIWFLLLSCLVDTVMLTVGINPNRAILDDVLVVMIAAPVLVLVYQNSWITVATSAVAGLAAGWCAKYRACP